MYSIIMDTGNENVVYIQCISIILTSFSWEKPYWGEQSALVYFKWLGTLGIFNWVAHTGQQQFVNSNSGFPTVVIVTSRSSPRFSQLTLEKIPLVLPAEG